MVEFISPKVGVNCHLCYYKKNDGGYCLYYWVLLLVNYVTIVAIRVEFYRCGSRKKLLLLLLLIIRGSVSFRVLSHCE